MTLPWQEVISILGTTVGIVAWVSGAVQGIVLYFAVNRILTNLARMSTRVNDLENQRDSSDLEGSWFIVDGDEAKKKKKGDCDRASGISDSQAKDKDALLERIIWLGPKALRRAVDDSRARRGSKRTSQDGGPANSSRQIDSHGKSAGTEVQDNTSKQGPRVDSRVDNGK